MAFLENSVAFFFLAAYLCLIKYAQNKDEKHVLLSAVFAGLSVLCKINGLIAPLFLVVYLAYHRLLLKNTRFLALTAGLISLFPITLMVVNGISFSELAAVFMRQYFVGMMSMDYTIQQYLLLSSLPSGYVLTVGSQQQLELWYIVSYVALAFIAVSEFEKVSDILLTLFSFIGLFYIVGRISPYYLIILQPFFAIPMGYYLMKLVMYFGGILGWTKLKPQS
jgi:4-amino-4-deoxy-L-arabinose transferase-like glycosyltransferase